MKCKYIIGKGTDNEIVLEGREALLRHLNQTEGLDAAVSRYMTEVGKEDVAAVQEWVKKGIVSEATLSEQAEVLPQQESEQVEVEAAELPSSPKESGDGVESIKTKYVKDGFNVQYERPDYIELFKTTDNSTDVGEFETRKIGEKITVSLKKDGTIDVFSSDYNINGGGLSAQAGKKPFYDLGKETLVEQYKGAPSAPSKENEEVKIAEQAIVEEFGQVGGETTVAEPTEVFTEIDTIIDLKGPDAVAARKDFKEKHGAEVYDKARRITREFDTIVNKLESEGKLKKVCP